MHSVNDHVREISQVFQNTINNFVSNIPQRPISHEPKRCSLFVFKQIKTLLSPNSKLQTSACVPCGLWTCVKFLTVYKGRYAQNNKSRPNLYVKESTGPLNYSKSTDCMTSSNDPYGSAIHQGTPTWTLTQTEGGGGSVPFNKAV